MFRWKNRGFTEDYNRYYPLVSSVAYSKVGNPEEAEDIVQEVFITYFNKYEEIENKRKWLFGTLRYEIFAYYRKKHGENVNYDEMYDDVAISFINGFKDLRIMLADIFEEDSTFNDEQEEILFNLIAVHGFSYQRAGKQLDLTKKQVRYRYTLVVRRILDSLKARGIKNLEDLL